MKRMLSIGAVLLATVSVARPPNYDESKVAPYALEDPLAFADGTKLSAVAQWPARRAEIVRIFEREMYGRTPPKPETVVTELREEGPTLGGQAIRRQYRMWFRTDRSGPHLDWLVVLPNHLGGDKPVVRDGKVVCETAAKVPVLLFLNYYGNHELLDDEEVFVPEDAWLRNNATHGIAGHRIVRPVRGAQRKTTGDGAFPIETIVGRGYAVISACYGQVSPDVEVKRGDPEELAYTGVFDLWPKRDPRATDNVTALGAWAWALSRGLDLAAEIPEIDARRSVATGCSRLAKTALLACSRDERFAVCVPCQTGGGGCPLAKRDFGENVSTEMQMFPHWYCRGYGKYVDNEQAMAFDQHLLLASIAPRALLVEGFNTGWFDTKGEYLACRAASPAWTFLGRPGLPDGGFPPDFDTSLIGPSFGYVRRGGAHGISGSDWNWTLDFADAALASVPQAEGPRQTSSPAKSDVLFDGFGNPHRSYGPETWWHWMNGNVSREGIVADLDAMAEIGLSGVHIFDAGCGIPPGGLKFNTPEWFETIRFAVTEAQKRGLRTTLANCSGYSTAGGPWITPENAMKTVRYSVRDVMGPSRLTELPPRPEDPYGFYEDIVVLAYPVPGAEEEVLRVPGCPGSVKAPKPLAATTLELRAKGAGGWSSFAQLTLEARTGDGAWRKLVDERIAFVDEGMMDCESRAFPFPETTATEWRVSVSPIPKGCSVSDIRISRAGRVPNVANKALFVRTRDGDLPYEVGDDQCVKADAIRRIPVSASGDVSWDVPSGHWRILRIGYAANGKKCHPASDNGVGFECDKLSKRGIGVHFDSYIGRMCDFLGPELSGNVPCGFNNVLVDSWEAGSQNWTRGLEGEFLSRKGYDLIPYLPVFAGAVVGDRETTERVLADFREVVASLFAENFSDEFARKCHARGLKLSIEPYGSFPSTPDLYARASDIGMCEFWVPPAYGLGDRTVRLVSDYYHARDPRKIIAAESFTGKPEESRWQQDPFALKAVGDRMYSIGVNRIVYHRYAHQPWTRPTRYPGMTMGQWGTHFERTETWWHEAKDWVRYQTRCQYLLQSGEYVASSREEPVRWLERKYEDGSRAFFLACSAPTAVTYKVELPYAQGEPELWDPETGTVVLADRGYVENAKTYLTIDFKPSGAVFAVFRPRRTAGARRREAIDLTESMPVGGPWAVSFSAPYEGAPAPIRMESLMPLNEHKAEDVRHFSGTSIYRTAFEWKGGRRAWIDLGTVKNLATVAVNGREYPVLWRPPFTCEITDSLREGRNELEVRVVNLWVNRLIGDEKLMPDVKWRGNQIREVPEWVSRGQPSPTGRHTFTTWHHWSKDDRLLDSGLLGPVCLRW